MTYMGQNMSAYIDQCTLGFTQLERMSTDAAFPDTHEAASGSCLYRSKRFFEIDCWYNANKEFIGPYMKVFGNDAHWRVQRKSVSWQKNRTTSDDEFDLENNVKVLSVAINKPTHCGECTLYYMYIL